MRFHHVALAAALSISPAIATAQSDAKIPTSPTAAATPKAHPAYTTADTDLGTLLDDPAAKAVLVKHVPTLVNNDQIDQARGMTLQALQPYAGEVLTDDAMKKIDADLAALAKAL